MCLTCDIKEKRRIPPGGIIYQDGLVILTQSIDIDIPGYLVLSPIRHVASYKLLTDEEIVALSLVLKKAVSVIEEIEGVEKAYICSFGEVTQHFHYHIFPKYTWMQDIDEVYTGDKFDGAKLFYKMRINFISDLTSSNEQIINIVSRIRAKMETTIFA